MNNSAVSWLWRVPGKKKWMIAALTLMQALHGGFGVLYALVLRNVVDAAVNGDAGLFKVFALELVGMTAVQLCLRAVIRWLNELSKSTFENTFKERLTAALLNRDYLHISALHSGEWMNRLTNDTVVVAGAYTEIVPGFTGMAVRLTGSLAALIILENRFAFILIPGGVFVLAFTWLFRKVLKKLHKRIQEADGRLRVFLQERIGSMLILRSYAAEKQTLSDAADKMEEHKAARMKRNRFSNLCNIGFGAAIQGLKLFGILWCGYGILTGTVGFGTMTAVMHLILQIQNPAANITGFLPRYYAMLASADRLMEIESIEGEDTEALSVHEVMRFYETELSSFGLRDVDFTYYPAAERLEDISKDDMPKAVRSLSADISKGEIVAFTGQSGCGKSTALKLLMCVFEPDRGERYIRDINGEVKPMGTEWRRMFAYVPQGNYLMSGTIRQVISFSDPGGADDDERLRRALKIACADDFVAELEKGADTVLGERGAGLSEGQMQRIAVARAVFSDSPVLLLDESTGALDQETERRLLENIRSLTDKTVLIVTHRPAALSICDKVLHFTDKGVEEA
ncbi:MAG: ABC transporter ATP-binding protein [Oscillospiraceae bacterium]|nr:ABC transporter ATP-binding protein [Oscillospiraceae bacterium]